MTFLELSLSGGVFVLAIAAFRGLTLRRLPKGTFVALWWLAAARLLLPVELASRFSVYTLLEALGPKAVPVVLDALLTPVVPSAPVAPAVPAAPPVIAIPSQPAVVPAPAPAPFPVWTALWLTVGLLLAAWFLIRYVRWRRRFREALPADCPGLETWFQLRRKVEVRVTDQIAAPLTYGLFRPVILLPKTMDFKDEEALTCVLAHERAHIRRLDGLLKLALTAALCLHWFNPAVWLLYVLGNRDMELRCDEAAVLALGEDSRERYALALIRLAEVQNQQMFLCGFSGKSGMEERIRAIMSIKKKSLLACVLALALVMSITTAFATSAKPIEEEPAKAEVQAPAKKTPAPAEKPEAPAPEKEEPPAKTPAPAPEAAPAANAEAPKAAAKGDVPVYSVGIGVSTAVVKEVGSNAQDGNYVRIALNQSQTQEVLYAHCQTIEVKEGDTVGLSQVIATVNSATTGPRLRFEMLVNGKKVDPMVFEAENWRKCAASLHSGFVGGEGEPIVSLLGGGTVLEAGEKDYDQITDYGRTYQKVRGAYLEIVYENGYSMRFDKIGSVLVKPGDTVQAGDVIGYRAGDMSGTGPLSPSHREDWKRAEEEAEEWRQQCIKEYLVNGDYRRNKLGLTYGYDNLASVVGYLPDLIPVVATNGEEGWASRLAVNGCDITADMTPEILKEYEESKKDTSYHTFYYNIPVYDDEGEEIGVFECAIQLGEHGYKTVEEVEEAIRNGEI
ncbi:M56 family metallopeptidase [uncultured Oscillibacter sp.]|uniref:M56 family metallopeptidase n=1 Tax=uncultured Oscillibacter sp. TaxID=876091 RepID=UPI0026398BC5|nr:M56 family metallopeptidase [uncultured Oscillibacter sp.]